MEKSCKHCGCVADQLHKHHIVPKSRGGNDSPENLILLCLECHGKAHDVSFKSDAGLIKDGIEKVRKKEKLSKEFFEENKDLVDEFFTVLEDENYDLYNFIVSGLLLGLIDISFLYGLVHPETNKTTNAHRITLSLLYRKQIQSIYEDCLK